MKYRTSTADGHRCTRMRAGERLEIRDRDSEIGAGVWHKDAKGYGESILRGIGEGGLQLGFRCRLFCSTRL